MAKHTDTALYRKYRPQTWNDVLGQEHIVRVLRAAIKNGAISHAYLFAGSRGTGKTSVARIFAREAGCMPEDLYEIDAASNRGIDDIRNLREAVLSLPLRSPHKIYIVDEAHMLTKEAWNAFLKTMEEPPKHTIFILATTELEKIPETIVSRCQVFSFKWPTQAILKELVIAIAHREGFTLEQSAADLVAILGDRSFRDAQGILQKVITASKDKNVSVREVEEVTGAPQGVLISECIEGIALGDLEQAIAAVHKALGDRSDAKIFLTLLLHKVRTILLLRYAAELEEELKEEFSETDFSFLKRMSGSEGKMINSKVLLELLSAYDLMRFADVPELALELAFMRIIGETEQKPA